MRMLAQRGGATWDNMQEESTTEGKVVLTKEQLEELINKASEGSIVDYSEDTKYDLTKLFRYRGEHLQKVLDEGVKNKEIRPEIAELCRIRLAMCSIINFDEVIKYYRSDDCSACEKELLKRLYLVFITPREAVEAGMLKIVAETGKIFEEEILGEKENTDYDMEE